MGDQVKQDQTPAFPVGRFGLMCPDGTVQQRGRLSALMYGNPGSSCLQIPGKQQTMAVYLVQVGKSSGGPFCQLITAGSKKKFIPRRDKCYCTHCWRYLMVEEATP